MELAVQALMAEITEKHDLAIDWLIASWDTQRTPIEKGFCRSKYEEYSRMVKEPAKSLAELTQRLYGK